MLSQNEFTALTAAQLLDFARPTMGEDVETDRALWQELAEDARNLEKFKPTEVLPMPWVLTKLSADQLRDILERHRNGGKVEAGEAESAKQFGNWRYNVTLAEAENCRRLMFLANTTRKASQLAARRPSDATQALAAKLVKAVLAWYRGSSMPTDQLRIRDWAISKTRAFDVLPREWRHL